MCSLLCNMGVFSYFGWNKAKIFFFFSLNCLSCVIKSQLNQHLLVVVIHFKLLKHVLPICGVTYHPFYSVLTTSQGIFLGTFSTSTHTCNSIPEHSFITSLQTLYFGVTVCQQNNFFTKLCYLTGWSWKSVGKYTYFTSFMNAASQKMTPRLEDFSLSHMNRMCKYSVRNIYTSYSRLASLFLWFSPI